MSRTAYTKPEGDLFQQSTYRTEKSVSGLPTGVDREKEQVLPQGAATPNSVSSDGKPADKGQGVGQRALPYGTFNGPASGSGTVEKARTKGVPGEQYGHPSKDDYGYLTLRHFTGSVLEVMASAVANEWIESDIVAYKPRKRNPSSYDPHPIGWRRHRQKPTQRNKRRKEYRRRRGREVQQARRRYRTRYRNNPRFKRRRQICRKYPNRCKMRNNPRPKKAGFEIQPISFLYGCDLLEGLVVGVHHDGDLILILDDESQFRISATAFMSTAVFLDEGDIDTLDYYIDSSDAEEPYQDPTPEDVKAAAALHQVQVPVEVTEPEEQLEFIFEAVMNSCSSADPTKTAHDTILYNQAPASEQSNNWMNRDEPTREVADTRPYKENAPGQWTNNRKEQTHKPSSGYVEPNPTYYQSGSGRVLPDSMRRIVAAWGPLISRTARFEVTPTSPLQWAEVDFAATRFSEPMDADEQGGFQVDMSRLDLNGSYIRDPGVAVFLPQRWPFSEVSFAEVTQLRLDNTVGLKFQNGRLVVTGRATYAVQYEWGERDQQTLPVRGLLALSSQFARRLEDMQTPPVEAPSAVDAGDGDKVRTLVELFERVGDWGKPMVAEAIDALRAGRKLDADTLKGLRHRLYRSNMQNEADMFRTASLRDLGFDDFDDVEPGVQGPAYRAMLDFERQVGKPSQIMALDGSIMRDAEVIRVAGGQLQYVAPHQAWFLYTDMDAASARRFGARAFRGLIGRRNTPVHLPALHQVPLWVGTADGHALRVDPPKVKG